MSEVQLHLGDCIDLMRGLSAGSFDATVTDPPYGVDFDYDEYQDDREAHSAFVKEFMFEILRVSITAFIFPGITHMFTYPSPKWTACYFKPGSTRRNGFGTFNEWEPLLIYGKPAKIVTDAKRFPDIVNHSPAWVKHPCPKPLNAIRWVVEMTPPGATIFDPFFGSGTTAVACIQTGRNFVGCERDPGYFEIAQRRIALAQQQPLLPFMTNGHDSKPTQSALALGE